MPAFGIFGAVIYRVREHILYIVKAGHINVLITLIDGKSLKTILSVVPSKQRRPQLKLDAPPECRGRMKKTELDNKRINLMKFSWIFLTFACALGLGLAGCSEADSGTFDMSLGDDPCAIVTASMVATTFNIPEADVEQSNVVASRCSYEMEDDNESLNVEVSVDAEETDEDAAKYFRRATRSMSSDEISDAVKAVRQEADKDGGTGTDAKQDAAEGIGAGLQQNGIQFQDVDGVADQARFDTSDGTLHLQKGNLQITIKAYYGPEMPIPDSYELGKMHKVVMAWMQDTMSDRKEQAVKLAKVALAEL